MDIGNRLRQARLEAGLSQRQLCGDTVTRNMLSQIENGAARPSMDTLAVLAARLGKSISYFLEENAVTSPNQRVMEQARRLWEQGDVQRLWQNLGDYQSPDPVFDREFYLLKAMTALALAGEAAAQGRQPYGLGLLEEARQAGSQTPYYTKAMERQRLLLLARLEPRQTEAALAQLEPLDEELKLRAGWALGQDKPEDALALLGACADREEPEYLLLRAEAYFCQKAYAQAAEYFRRVEDSHPHRAIPRLEQCYCALEDYKMAYHYARLARKE